MKRNIKNIIISVIAFTAIVLLLSKAGYWETHYITTGNIIAIENNTMLICDKEGELWRYDIVNNLTIGDEVKLVMWNNTTDINIHDDEIVEIKKLH